MHRTTKFCCEVLGLPLVKTIELPDGTQHFFFDMGAAYNICISRDTGFAVCRLLLQRGARIHRARSYSHYVETFVAAACFVGFGWHTGCHTVRS